VIAGTGRAGTSFLVKFLQACGLHAGELDDGDWIERARAGLELDLLSDDAPQLVKDPMFFTYCNEINLDLVRIEALIIPVRELMAAATSRVLQERATMAETARSSRPLTHLRGGAAGGVVYSLDPVDQARILAVGFHQVIHWATANAVPLFLLDFPRIILDGDYLIDTLWPWLGSHCEKAVAHGAFDAIADPSALRIVKDPDETLMADAALAARLDRDAMAMLVAETKVDLASTRVQVDELLRALDEAGGRSAELAGALRIATRQLGESEMARDTMARTLAERDQSLVGAERQLSETGRALSAAEDRAGLVQAQYDKLQRNLSWRLTRPFRALAPARRRGVAVQEEPLAGS
jgi:hypothetical protein